MEVTNILNQICLAKISPSKMNPRKTFDEESLKELADNISHQGLLQPITVRPIDFDDEVVDGQVVTIPTKYEIVCGERRYRAFKQAFGEDADIPCIVKEMSDKEAFDAMITENLQRKDVDPIEEAFAFAQLIENGGDIDEIALRFGKSRRFVQERVKLNSLVPKLKEATTSGVLPIAAAMMLAKLKTELQDKFAKDKGDRLNKDCSYKIDVAEVRRWINQEFLYLSNAIFLDWPEDDKEDHTPKEEWNTKFDKCATCYMNTGCSGCLFYSMNDNPQCTDRDCFERKSVAYIIQQLEVHEKMLAKSNKIVQPGQSVILINDTNFNYGYDNIKRIRKAVIEEIEKRGWLIATEEMFDGKCKYYGDDERLPKLLKNHKVVECYTIGTPWNLEVDKEYWYTKGSNAEKNAIDPQEEEAKKLSQQYDTILNQMNDKATDELAKLIGTKNYTKRKGELTETEEYSFWSLVVKKCGHDVLEKMGLSEYYKSEEIYKYVHENFSEDNMRYWVRCYIAEQAKGMNSYNSSGLVQRIIRAITRDFLPTDAEAICKKFADRFEKKVEKIKDQLKELGYDIQGKKLKKK